jgi:hypothetical protein
MAKGISIHIGVNKIDHDHYVDMIDLDFCEADAVTMEEMARNQGFSTSLLLGSEATRDNVSAAIEEASKQLEAGDFCLITYAGHGCYVPDTNKDERNQRGHRLDRRDETWCLYDAQQVDDERAVLWSQFAEGVRICVLSDSCHSGTTARGNRSAKPGPTFKTRAASRDAALGTYEKHKDFYDSLQREAPPIEADLILMSGCQDHQESGEDADIGHGNFTYALSEIYANGAYDGNYVDLWEDVKFEMPDYQTPNLFPYDLPDFVQERPFSI